MLAIGSNNTTTQTLIGKLGGIPHLVQLLMNAKQIECREHATCAHGGTSPCTLAVSHPLLVHEAPSAAAAPSACMLASPPGAAAVSRPLLAHRAPSPKPSRACACRCALWHLASTEENKATIAEYGGIPPLVEMLISDRMLAVQLATMTIVSHRLLSIASQCFWWLRICSLAALTGPFLSLPPYSQPSPISSLFPHSQPSPHLPTPSSFTALAPSPPSLLIHSPRPISPVPPHSQVRLTEGAAGRATAKLTLGIAPLVRLLTKGTEAVMQTAAAALAAIAFAKVNRDQIANAGGIRPLIRLLNSTTLGTRPAKII